MSRILLTAIGAGAAAALLFALPLFPVPAILSVPAFYLAALPIMIVALDWSHWAAIAAAVAAAAILAAGMPGAASAGAIFIVFLVVTGLPAWWLGYLSMLGRPVANSGPAGMEWYPPGRLVLWAAALGTAVAAGGTLALFWGNEEAIRTSLKAAVEAVLHHAPDARMQIPPEISGIGDADAIVDMMLRLMPPAAAMSAALAYTLNLWLAGVAVRLSGRLQRPWPDLTALSFPPWIAGLYGLSLAGTFLPGAPGVAASLIAAPLTSAFAIAGFAVAHAVTRGLTGRMAILWTVYLCAFLLVSPLVMTVAGVAETLFDLRARFARDGPPAVS
jgi:hypothetical protein